MNKLPSAIPFVILFGCLIYAIYAMYKKKKNLP